MVSIVKLLLTQHKEWDCCRCRGDQVCCLAHVLLLVTRLQVSDHQGQSSTDPWGDLEQEDSIEDTPDMHMQAIECPSSLPSLSSLAQQELGLQS